MKKREYIHCNKKEKHIKSDGEIEYFRFLSKVERRLTLFSVADNLRLRFIRSVSRRGLTVKIILSL